MIQRFILIFATILQTSMVSAQIPSKQSDVDVVLIGGGIMSATLATLLHELDPNLKIVVYERLPNLAFESSSALNNAGTGHAALSELNYTPQKSDGSIDVTKALKINQEFELSKELWAYLVSQGKLKSPQEFIHAVPHMSWVHGQTNVDFLKKRFEALKNFPHFQDMEYTEETRTLQEWMPVLMDGRAPGEVMAATRSLQGTDVDYGRLTTALFENLIETGGLAPFANHEVRKLKQDSQGLWHLVVKDLASSTKHRIRTKFVFIGAGGGTLPLLQQSGVPEAAGYGGFPIGGEFLIYKQALLAEQHLGKVYGQAAVGAPPMSVPHLDTRIINGQKRLLFGPFASMTTRFLKQGSWTDLLSSLRFDNLGTLLKTSIVNRGLVKYLLSQETQSHEDRVRALREFLPHAKAEEWETIEAGVRVQIVKYDRNLGGDTLRFGTEVVSAAGGTLAALLGASPGASISVAAMLEVLEKSFPELMQSDVWKEKLSQMIPSYKQNFEANVLAMQNRREQTQATLQLSFCSKFFRL